MVAIKITFSVLGNNFKSSIAVSKISKELNVLDYFEKSDNIDEYSNKKYGYGCISLIHPKIFEFVNNSLEFENTYINFFEKNYNLFIDLFAKEFEFFIEVYYSENQCNFEIFNKKIIHRLNANHCEISFPVSVYQMSEVKIKDLFN